MFNCADFSTWAQFFKNAQIPQQFVNNYASKFCENRIRFDMLSDIDKTLLNEMGITAIGDCLSILKHAKVIITKLDEDKKEAFSKENQKKRGEVAKRIIETYLGDQEVKSEKQSNTLSQDLMSRLNFTKSPIVKFNEDSLGKVVVSSTTDDLDFADNKKKLNLKRRLNDNSSDSESIDDGKPLEYRGLLKNTPDLNQSAKPNSLNEALKMNKTGTKIIKLNKNKLDESNDKIGTGIQSGLESIRKESVEQNKKVISLKKVKESTIVAAQSETDKKESVFKRIKPVVGTSSAPAAVRLLKDAALVKKTETKIIPITNDFKKSASNIVRLNQPVKRLNEKSVHDRLTFKK